MRTMMVTSFVAYVTHWVGGDRLVTGVLGRVTKIAGGGGNRNNNRAAKQIHFAFCQKHRSTKFVSSSARICRYF